MTGWILITAGAVLCTLVFSGIYFTSRTRRKVSYMLDALEDKETNFRFREDKWPDRKFNRTLNRIRGIFEKEQTEILEQEKYFGKMLDNVQTGIVVISEGERIEYSNKKALSLLGMATFSTVRPRISALNAILAVYSSVYVLILGIYYKLQTFLYLPASGFVQGMRPIIGYNYGAGEEVRVKRIFFTVLVMCVLIMFLGTLLSIIFPSKLIGLFTDNQETITKGSLALRIISGGFIISSVSVAASGALEGLGKGFPSLVISLLRYIVIIIPLAYFLSQIPSLGAEGVWHAFWLSEVVTAVFSFMILRSIFRKRV